MKETSEVLARLSVSTCLVVTWLSIDVKVPLSHTLKVSALHAPYCMNAILQDIFKKTISHLQMFIYSLWKKQQQQGDRRLILTL